MLTYYKPSGRFGPSAFILLPMLLAAAVAASWLYQFLVGLIPFIYLNALMTVGFGFGLYVAVAYMLKLGKCRNVAVGALIGFIVGVAAFVGAHYFDYRSAVAGVQPPVPYPEYMQFRVDHGWTLGRYSNGIPITGPFVYLVWLIEAGIIILGATRGGIGGASEPFCEACGFRASRPIRSFIIPHPAPEAADAIAAAQSIDDLTAPRPAHDRHRGVTLVYNARACPACDQFAVLSIQKKTESLDKRGRRSSATAKLKTNVLLTPDDVAAVTAMADSLESALAAPPAPTAPENPA